MPGKWLLVSLMLLAFSVNAQVNHEYFMSVGRAELSGDNFKEAINSFTIVISVRPDHFEAYFLRGIAKYNLGDFIGAEQDFTVTVHLHPLYSFGYHYRGIVRDQLHDYYNALNDLDKSIELDPFNPNLYVSRGAVKLHLESYLWSIIDFDSALSLDANISLAYLNRAVAKSMLNDFDGALRDCDKAVQLSPYNDGAFLRRGVIKYEMDDYEGAVLDFDFAIKLNKDNAYTYFNRALARFYTGDTLGTLSDYSKVIQLDPYNALSYYNRALLKTQMGDLVSALGDFDKVLMINPNNIYTYYNRAITKHQLKDYRGAIDDYSQAILLFPDFAGAYLNRSDARRTIGDEKGAWTDYERAYQIMEALNTGRIDSIMLVKRYTDSTYFDKIIEFEAEFISLELDDESANGRGIDLEPPFILQFIMDEAAYVQELRQGYFNKVISDINENNTYNLKFAITNKEIDLSLEDAYHQIIFADSIVKSDLGARASYFYRGIINGMVRNYYTAIQDYNMAISLDPSLVMAYLNRAMVAYEREEQNYFEQKYRSTVKISWGEHKSEPDNPTLASPDFGNAILDLNKVIELNPGLAFAYYNRAHIKNRLKDYYGAIQDNLYQSHRAPG
jgi:tetratricopeptide (TPR) repeat protein